jgi:hypothetical protein
VAHPGHGLADLCGGRLPHPVDLGHHRLLQPGEERIGVDATVTALDHPDRLAPLRCRHRVGTGRLHDRHQVEGDHEQGAAHAHHPHHRPLFVEGAFHLGPVVADRPGEGAEEHGGRVGGVHRQHPGSGAGGSVGPSRWSEPVADTEPGPPLGSVESPH